MKYLLVFLLLAATDLVLGAVKKVESRPSRFMGTLSKGPESYQSILLDASFGLNQNWAMDASFFQSDSGTATLLNEELISKEQRLGADWKINKTWGSSFGIIARQDPYEVVSQGAYLSGRANINHWWKGKKSTAISLKAEFLKMAQDLQVQGKFVTLKVYKYVEQKNAYISLNQEFADYFFLTIGHNKYTYSEESSSLGLTTSSRRTSLGGGALSYGYPEYTNSVEVLLIPYDWMELRLEGSTTKTLGNSTKTQTGTLGASFFWESFQFDLEYSQSDYGTTSGTQSQKQAYQSIGLGYNW